MGFSVVMTALVIAGLVIFCGLGLLLFVASRHTADVKVARENLARLRDQGFRIDHLIDEENCSLAFDTVGLKVAMTDKTGSKIVDFDTVRDWRVDQSYRGNSLTGEMLHITFSDPNNPIYTVRVSGGRGNAHVAKLSAILNG